MSLPDAPILQAELERACAETGLAGAAFAVLHGGRTVDVAAGVLSVETGLPVRTDSLFQIGSVTKAITATLIMQAHEEGLIDLDRPIRHYLEGLPIGGGGDAEQVTVRHLLAHTSGFDGDLFEDVGPDDDCLAKFAFIARQLDLMCAPGRYYNYCNAGYALLGRIVERVRGEVYDVALQARLFHPIGAARSTSLVDELPFRSPATGHFPGPGGKPVVAPPVALPRALGPAGLTFWSNAGELVRFAALHMGQIEGGPLRPSTAEAMRRRQVTLPDGSGWGLGWKLIPNGGLTFVGHDGGTIGHTAYLWFSPENGLAVALCANGGGREAFKQLAWPIFEGVCGGVPEIELPEPSGPPASLTDYVGVYRNIGVTMEVTAEDGHLLCRAKVKDFGQPDVVFPMLPIGEDRFRATIGDDDRVVTAFLDRGADGRPGLFYAGRLHRRVEA